MNRPRPERIAAIARGMSAELSLRVSMYADALAQSLADELQLVAWDREQLIGGLQVRLRTLDEERFSVTERSDRETPGVRVIERRRQPLESIDLAWRNLRAGFCVLVEHEMNACSAALELLRGMARAFRDQLGAEALQIADVPVRSPLPDPSASASAFRLAMGIHDPVLWRLAGPAVPGPRIAWIGPHADRELAAYVLARASLRRTGMDPRAVKRAFIVGPTDLLRRHLIRLWVGATMGPASAAGSFAGPVTDEAAEEFLATHEAWSTHPDVECWCPGGELDRADSHERYLAPALFATSWPAPDLPATGPLLVVVRCTSAEARAGAITAAREEGQVITIGAEKYDDVGDVTHIRGALLVERLPPGLPGPRPV